MPAPESISNYLRTFASELGERILKTFPPLHAVDDPPSPLIAKLLRKPYPAQSLAIMGLVQRWQQARAGAVIAECGTGKTLISLGAIHAGEMEDDIGARKRVLERSGWSIRADGGDAHIVAATEGRDEILADEARGPGDR